MAWRNGPRRRPGTRRSEGREAGPGSRRASRSRSADTALAMPYNSNFDVDSVLQVLGTVNEKYQEGSPEDEALRIAAVALLYVRDLQKLEEYREYFRKFYIPAIESVVVSQTFATREEADAWLASGKASEERTRANRWPGVSRHHGTEGERLDVPSHSPAGRDGVAPVSRRRSPCPSSAARRPFGSARCRRPSPPRARPRSPRR